MLVVALVVEHQVAGARLVEVAADQPTVELHQLDRIHVGPDLAATLLPVLRQAPLLGTERQLRGQVAVGQAVGAQPLAIVDFQRLVGGEAHQAGAVLLVPARTRPLAQLFLGDAHEPGAEYLRLLRVERYRGLAAGNAAGQQEQRQAEGSQASHSDRHSSGSHCHGALAWLPAGRPRA